MRSSAAPHGEAHSQKSRGRVATALMIALACLPAAFTLVLITRYWVNVPFWDQWHFGYTLEKYYQHTFTPWVLMEQANESRPFFPYLLFLVLARLTQWDVRAESAVIFVVVCITSWMILKVLERTESGSLPARLAVLGFVNLILFSPVCGNWLWGFMLLMYVPPLALMVALWANLSGMCLRNRILAAALCSIVATFSFPNGLLLWPLAIPLPWVSVKPGRQERRVGYWYLGYTFLFLLTVAFYFHGYTRPSQHPELVNPLSQPLFALRFVLSWLGYPFTAGTVVPAAAFGGVLLAGFLAFSAYGLSGGRRARTARLVYPWVIVGLYAWISGCIVFLGRSRAGLAAAIAERYMTTSSYFAVAGVLLAFVLYQRCWAVRLTRTARVMVAAGTALFGLAILIPSDGYASVISNMSAVKKRNERIQTALTFINVIPDNPDLAQAHPSIESLRRQMRIFEANSALKFPIFDASLRQQLTKPWREDAGALHACELHGPDSLRVNGSMPNASQTSTDFILFTYSGADGGITPFGAIPVDASPVFSETLNPTIIRPGRLSVAAWKVTSRDAAVTRLMGTCEIEMPQGSKR